MSPSFARIAPTYDALRPLSAEDRARLDAMLRDAAIDAGDLVIEVGCGTGRLTLPLAGVRRGRGVGVGTEGRMPGVAAGQEVGRGRGGGGGRAFRPPLARGAARLGGG